MVQNSYLPHLMYIHANLLHFSKDHMLQCEHVWTLYIVRRGTKLKINQWLLKWLRLISLLGISCFKLFAMFPNSRTKHIDSLDMKDELNEIASLGFLFQHLNSFFKKHGYPNCLVLINRGFSFRLRALQWAEWNAIDKVMNICCLRWVFLFYVS